MPTLNNATWVVVTWFLGIAAVQFPPDTVSPNWTLVIAFSSLVVSISVWQYNKWHHRRTMGLAFVKRAIELTGTLLGELEMYQDWMVSAVATKKARTDLNWHQVFEMGLKESAVPLKRSATFLKVEKINGEIHILRCERSPLPRSAAGSKLEDELSVGVDLLVKVAMAASMSYYYHRDLEKHGKDYPSENDPVIPEDEMWLELKKRIDQWLADMFMKREELWKNAACEILGVDHEKINKHIKKDPFFSKKFYPERVKK